MERKKQKEKLIYLLILVLILGAIFIIKKDNFNKNKQNSNTNVINEMPDNIDKMPDDTNIDLNYKDNVSINDNLKNNVSSKIKGKHYLENGTGINNNLFVSDIEIYADSKTDKCYFNGKITNTGEKSQDLLMIFINFYDSNGNFFANYQVNVENLKGGETQEISFDDIHDFSNAYSVKILY